MDNKESAVIEKENKKGVLTPKMVDLLAVVAEHDYLTINEVGMVYTNQTHAYKVMGQLTGQGLVTSFHTFRKPRKAYCLTTQGYKTLAQEGRLRVQGRFNPELYKPFIFNHRVALVQARLILAAHPLVVHYATEKMIWEKTPKGQKVLDGGLRIKNLKDPSQSHAVGIELELTLKNKDKLRESFERFGKDAWVDYCWWICKDQGLMDSLMRALADEGARENFHFFMLWKDLIKRNWRLTGLDGTAYSLDAEGMNWPPEKKKIPPPAPVPDKPKDSYPDSFRGRIPSNEEEWKRWEKELAQRERQARIDGGWEGPDEPAQKHPWNCECDVCRPLSYSVPSEEYKKPRPYVPYQSSFGDRVVDVLDWTLSNLLEGLIFLIGGALKISLAIFFEAGWLILGIAAYIYYTAKFFPKGG